MKSPYPLDEPKKVLVVGHSGYHQDNYEKPLIDALRCAGAEVTTDPLLLDFFAPTFDWQVWCQGYVTEADALDLIVFLEWFNGTVPLLGFQMWKAQRRIPIAGLFHGSAWMPGDVAADIPFALAYERFLCEAYDLILTGYIPPALVGYKSWCKAAMPARVDLTGRPQYESNPKRVVYAARWNADKGCDRFASLTRTALKVDPEIRFIVCSDVKPLEIIDQANVTWKGWLQNEDLDQMYRQMKGGWIWGGAQSEIWWYSGFNATLAGLTPLVSLYDAYNRWPDRLRYTNSGHALVVMKTQAPLTNKEYADATREVLGAADRWAQLLLALEP